MGHATRTRDMVATTAESTFIVITAPTTLPRPRHFSNRCIEEAMIPRIARGREMGKTKTVFYGEETGGVGYKGLALIHI